MTAVIHLLPLVLFCAGCAVNLPLAVGSAQEGMARVRVLDEHGHHVRSFGLSLKHPDASARCGFREAIGFEDVLIVPTDLQDGFAAIHGIPPGDFAFQITADHHARTLSAPFHVTPGGAAPEVTVQLTLGGSLRGRVVDDRGRPIADALVRTYIHSHALATITMPSVFPDGTCARTDSQGCYRLTQLAFDDYALRVSHPGYCDGAAVGLAIEDEAEVPVADIGLTRGTIVEGITSIDRKPAGQIEVRIEPSPGEESRGAFALSELGVDGIDLGVFARSDDRGRYRLARMPPDTYQIQAFRRHDGSPFETLVDLKESQRTLLIQAGLDRAVQDFDLH